MADRIAQTRDAVSRASDATDETDVRTQLQSIDEALAELPPDEAEHGDRLAEIEQQLARLLDRTAPETRTHLEAARDAIDAHRREETRDW